jgi:hypothetical protein
MSIRASLFAVVLALTGMSAQALADLAPGPGPRGQAGRQNPRQNQADADADAATAGGVLCFTGVFILLAIGLKVGIILFIVSDAKKRGMDPTMWVILEIFVGLVGLIVYLCVREPLLSERRRRPRRERDEDDDYDDDRPRRSRRLRDDDDHDRGRDRDKRRDDGGNPFDFG